MTYLDKSMKSKLRNSISYVWPYQSVQTIPNILKGFFLQGRGIFPNGTSKQSKKIVTSTLFDTFDIPNTFQFLIRGLHFLFFFLIFPIHCFLCYKYRKMPTNLHALIVT